MSKNVRMDTTATSADTSATVNGQTLWAAITLVGHANAKAVGMGLAVKPAVNRVFTARTATRYVNVNETLTASKQVATAIANVGTQVNDVRLLALLVNLGSIATRTVQSVSTLNQDAIM